MHASIGNAVLMKRDWRPLEHIKYNMFWRHSVIEMPACHLLCRRALLLGFLATYWQLLNWAPLCTAGGNYSSARRLAWMPPGPQQLLITKNFPRHVQTDTDVRRYVKSLTQNRRKREDKKKEAHRFAVPGYLWNLRDRHSQEWEDFGEGEAGKGIGLGKLGTITAIRHHRLSGELTHITRNYIKLDCS